MKTKKEKTRSKGKILAECVKNGIITQAEKEKFEKAMYDKKNKGKGYNFELASKMYQSALKMELQPTKKVQDAKGKVHNITNVGEHRVNLMYLHDIYTMEKPYLNNPDSLHEAIDKYLSLSLKYNEPLSVNCLAIALGVSRATLKSWHEGRSRVNNKEIIDQAFSMIDAQTELSIRQGKGNVVGQIFLAKNDSGYVDEQKISIKEDKIDDLTEEELQQKYAEVIDNN